MSGQDAIARLSQRFARAWMEHGLAKFKRAVGLGLTEAELMDIDRLDHAMILREQELNQPTKNKPKERT